MSSGAWSFGHTIMINFIQCPESPKDRITVIRPMLLVFDNLRLCNGSVPVPLRAKLWLDHVSTGMNFKGDQILGLVIKPEEESGLEAVLERDRWNVALRPPSQEGRPPVSA
jgi:hypothetical protein